MRDLDIESGPEHNEEREGRSRIIDLDEWPKFDQRGRSAILDDEGQGPLTRENFQEHTWFASSPLSPLPPSSLSPFLPVLLFFTDRFLYPSSLFFRGPRIFFLPLGRPSAVAEGAAKTQDPRRGG